MKFFSNVLDQETMNLVIQDLNNSLSQNVWRSSQLCWSKEVLEKITGDCSVTFASDNIADKIQKCLVGKLPTAENVMIQYYVWKQNSGIALHNDRTYEYGATIYLNKNWDINSGGIFLWKEDNSLKGVCPEYNNMVIVDKKELHLVTPVSPLSTEFRYTIQIWGFSNNEVKK
jgi:Rps23 Pro-64 3,4-dihydroxylase Tpa1-like proline 4-hydroxylase